MAAAAEIKSPVLLIHGAADWDTPPAHSQRVLAALAGPKRLILVPGAGHNESLRGAVWDEIERWLDGVLDPIADGKATDHLVHLLRGALGSAEGVDVRWTVVDATEPVSVLC